MRFQTKTHLCGRGLIRFRWSSVDDRKRCKNASVDENLFIHFQETENGGFRKRISVDRASVSG